ncbi:protein male-specific lethal-1 [Stomoxys calcitrans]|uniref:PEHE domain-containing protein n=1 Tax=Stomoxys calcitrans TaxID=35570 RepID=A0A1I8Q6Z5_STOCA|nr:protein male-specific lethal-1 [Stomoxys calcitrans]
MEGKCNKAPNNTNNKYLDHVYCHPTQAKSVYNNNMTSGNGGGGITPNTNSDVLALLKENKQLKGMLILHLDLIQEQSDQLMALRARNAALENSVQELQRQLQKQIKRSGEISTLPPPPLAKIQCKTSSVTTNIAAVSTPSTAENKTSPGSQGVSNIIGVCNGKFINKIVLQRVSSARGKQRSENQTSFRKCAKTVNLDILDAEEIIEDDHEDENDDGNEEEITEEAQEDVETENDDDQDEVGEAVDTADKSNDLQAHIIDDFYDTGNSTEDSNEVLAVQSKRLRLKQAAKQSLVVPRGAKPSVSPASTTTNDGQTAFKAVSAANTAVSRGKQMTIMRWHAPDYHTDESVSCDSTAETEKRSTSVTSFSPPKPSTNANDETKRYRHTIESHHSHPRPKVRKCTYISTPQLYSTREWKDEPFSSDYDYEALKSEIKLAKMEKLEIPKWTEHELTPSYCIEGTEDLSDDIFFKRHAKLEVDEKRRKKWDVQQIREQRRIERLKRRHCKDEIQHPHESTSLHSFYPTTENIQTICYVQDLPVQAFGEMIPRIASSFGDRKDFLLPWLDKAQLQYNNDNNKKPTVTTLNSSGEVTTSSQSQNQMLNSSFVMLKKRKRQQSSTFGTSHPTSRQRSLATKSTPVTLSIPASNPVVATSTSCAATASINCSTNVKT